VTAQDVRALDEKGLKSQPFPKVRQDFRVYIREEAFDAAVARGEADTTREVGGVLVGEVLRDDSGPYVVVETVIDALHAEEKGAELTFTHKTWEHIHKEMDTRFAGKKVVGWYHTHPGFGIFLSDRDQFIHRSFFNLPFQVALVYDPKSRAHGVFSWHANEAWRTRRYWIGANEHLWDGPRAPAPPPAVPAPAPERDREEPKPSSPLERVDLLSVVVAALVVAVVAGIGGWWLGSRSSAELVNNLGVELARAHEDGARQAVASLDAELLGLLKATLGDAAVQRPLDDIRAQIAEALLLLQPGEPDDVRKRVLARLRGASDTALRISGDRAMAASALARLEENARVGSAQIVERQLAVQRLALAQLYVELATDAAKAGDPNRAARLLQTAATVDPTNRSRYLREQP